MPCMRRLGLSLSVVLVLALVALAVACSPAATPTPTPTPTKAATATPTPAPTATPTAAVSQEPIKIGALFAVSGFNSPLGTPERDTALMLEKQINAAGGINGRKLQLVIYDTESDETKAVTLAKKLIEQDKVLAIIGPSSTGESIAIRDTVTKAEIPLVSAAASILIVTPIEQAKWVFKTPQSDVLAVEALFEYLKGKGLTKVALLTSSGGFGKTGKAALDEAAPRMGMTVAGSESFGDTDTDMTPQLTKLKGSGAQALIVWGTNPGPAIIAKNAKQINLGMPIFNSHGIANQKFIELAGDAAEGITFPAGHLLLADYLPASDPQKAVLTKYRDDFQKEYGRGADTFGGHAYDALMMIKAALEKSGPDKAKLRDALENTTGFVGTGGIFNMSATDHNGLTKDAFEMVEIKGGKWAPAD